ncbi:hypothetical protein VTN00DRAFT_5157 [Thermoascus crustaceus]|uniref:uncharacterized protein n=1 Tax=Thermoascus crustaceus TaxID=5088 RepID=UPI003742351C
MGPHWKHFSPDSAVSEQSPSLRWTAIPTSRKSPAISVSSMGGGSSGTYAAIRLLDSGKTVAAASMATPNEKFIGLRTADVFANYTPPDPTAALAAYGAQFAKYPRLEEGLFLPDLIPDDLLTPFGEFVRKYSLDDAVSTIFRFGQGLGDLLRQPTLYVFKNFGIDVLHDIQIGFLDTVHQDNHEIYDRVLDILGPDAVFLRSRVLAMDRSTAPDHVQTREPRRLRPLFHEQQLFGSFRNSAYYTCLLRGAGLPDSTPITNFAGQTPFHLPPLPGLYSIMPTVVPGLFDVKYGSPFPLPDSVVKADIIPTIKSLAETNITTSTPDPEFVAFNSHTPFELAVSTEAIKSGFYKELYALQGRRNTFYTGAAFHTQASPLLWRFTEGVV